MSAHTDTACTGADVLDVVHIITTLTPGGAERQLESLVSRSRHRAHVVALYEGGVVADAMVADGVAVTVLGMAGWRKLLAWVRLARLLRQLRPDVVHVHLLAAQLWGIPAARLARVPVIVSSEHSLMEDSAEGRPYTRWLRLLYQLLERMSSHTIAVSTATAERLGRWQVPGRRITVIDNGIDFAALAASDRMRREVRQEWQVSEQTIVIGSVGRLAPVKRMDAVLRAAAPRLRSGGHLLVVAGEGDLAGQLRDLAGSLGVEQHVRWLGARTDVPRLLNGMDVLLSPSRDETFGIAIVEAVANGMPVVFAQCPALEVLPQLPPGAVRIPARGSPEEEQAALSAALDEICSRGPGRRPVPDQLVARYDIGVTTAAVDQLYQDLRARGRSARARGRSAAVTAGRRP